MTQDIRWIQRFEHFKQALAQLRDADSLAKSRLLSKLEEQGMIQAFEYTFELAWNLLKDFLESRGVRELYGSQDVIRAAFQRNLLDDGNVWMTMIESRNLTNHTYDEAVAQRVITAIRNKYIRQFDALEQRMQSLRDEDET